MSIIRNIGEQFEHSIEALQIASTRSSEGQCDLAEGQSLLRGLAEGSDNPDLQEAITAYARAMQAVGELAGQIALIGDSVFTIANRMGYSVDRVQRASSPPTVGIKGILEPTPVGGDRGNTTPEQFRIYELKEGSVNTLIELGVDPRMIEGYIATGGCCQVYRTEDGKVIKLPVVKYEDGDSEEETEPVPPPAGTAWYEYGEALKKAQGEAGLEQYVAYIDDRGIAGAGGVVCEMAPGVTFNKLLLYEINAISVEQLDVLMHAFQALERHELHADSDLENLMFDDKQGFTIIDFTTKRWHLRKHNFDSPAGIADEMARNFARSVFNRFGGQCVDEEMQQINEFVNKFTDSYGRTFGTEAIDDLHAMMKEMRQKTIEAKKERLRWMQS